MRHLPLLLTVGFVIICATAFAGTRDGETPAEEGVCDDLKYATPGLYGLCIAFCEAQDCEPDLSLDNPFENCSPSSEKLLRNYERKMQEGDPYMPCINPPPACPCFTTEDLEQFVADLGWPPSALCWTNWFRLGNAFVYIRSVGMWLIPDQVPATVQGAGVYLEDSLLTSTTNYYCSYISGDLDVYLEVAREDYVTCNDMVLAWQAANGGCPPD